MNINESETRNGQDDTHPGPFGYSFLSPMDTPYEPAPAPPPGPALLDDNESNMLHNFFTTMNSNHFTTDFWLRSQPDKNIDSINFEWPGELPPTFEGSTTSIAQPMLSHKSSGGMIHNNVGTNPDILAAASMLYQNGMNGSEFNPAFGQHPLSTFSDLPFNNPHLNGQSKNQPPDNYMSSKQQSPPRAHIPVGFHTSEMLFDTHEPMSAEQQASEKVRPLCWGSDSSFMDQGYLAPPGQPNEEERTKELLTNLECFEPQTSATNTRAPSPERMMGGQNASWTESGVPGPLLDLRRDYKDSMEDLSQPKKKLRPLIKEEDDENSDGDIARPRSRRSKGPGHGKPRRTSNDLVRKSRSQQGGKPNRENLTEEQKRSNHILSEQKRRNLIRQGFDDLCTLVPGLKGGGFSKSAMLTQTADWLEDLLRGNEILKAQLAELTAMNGLVMPQ